MGGLGRFFGRKKAVATGDARVADPPADVEAVAGTGEPDRRHQDELTRLASLHVDEQRYGEAEAILRRVLALEEAARLPDASAVVAALQNLATVCAAQERTAEALQLLQRAAALCDKATSVNDGLAIVVLENLARLHAGERRYREQRNVLDRLIALLIRSRGPGHRDIEHHLHYLAAACVELGDYAAAEAACQQALGILERSEPTDLRAGAATLANLGRVLRLQGRLDDAAEQYKLAVLTIDTDATPDRKMTASVLGDYTALLHDLGRTAEADAMAARAAAMRAPDSGDGRQG